MYRVKTLYKNKGIVGIGQFIDEYFKSINVTPTFPLAESDPETFKKNRQDLSNRAGILLSSHPSRFFDETVIAKVVSEARAAKPKSVKFIVHDGLKERLGRIFPDHEYFIDAPREYNEETKDAFWQMISECQDHLKTPSGLVVVFPAGRQETTSEPERRRFKAMVPVLLSTIDPDLMVYSLHYDSKIILNELVPRLATQSSGIVSGFFSGGFSINRFVMKSRQYNVYEKVSDVRDWSFDGLSHEEQKDAATEKFFAQFDAKDLLK